MMHLTVLLFAVLFLFTAPVLILFLALPYLWTINNKLHDEDA